MYKVGLDSKRTEPMPSKFNVPDLTTTMYSKCNFILGYTEQREGKTTENVQSYLNLNPLVLKIIDFAFAQMCWVLLLLLQLQLIRLEKKVVASFLRSHIVLNHCMDQKKSVII